MAVFMIQAAYTAEAAAAMVKNPQDRSKPFAELTQKLGGRLISDYFCFGEYDIVAIFEVPDDETALATSMAAITPGHVKAIKTTRLFTMEETMGAMSKAGSVTYQGPSQG